MSAIVLGMHRSGTSAATRMASLLGVPVCRPDDLSADRKGNERGVWESASLVRYNDRLLGRAGAAWWCPPPESYDWTPLADDERDSARARFRAVHPGPYWLWKDPRNCLTLPFWLRALAVRPPVILMLRNPLEIAASLTARNGFAPSAGLALWERHVRQAVRSVAGLPVLVTRYDDLLVDPAAWCGQVADLWEEAGVPVRRVRAVLAGGYLSTTLRHSSRAVADLDTDPDVSDEQRALAALVGELRGAHPRFRPPPLGSETPGTERFFAEQRVAHGLVPAPTAGPAAAGLDSGVRLFAVNRPGPPDDRPTAPAASVVVISKDEGRWLRATVDGLTATAPGAEVVVVDDGSTDGSVEGVEDLPGVRVVRSGEPLGIARARNLGARTARGQLLVFSDAHVAPAPGWLPALSAALQDPTVGAANPAIHQIGEPDHAVHGLTFDGPLLNVRWLSGPCPDRPFPVALLTGCFLALRREVFEALSGFDEGMTGYGAEDLELCLRLWRMNYRCVSVPATKVGHRFRSPDAQRIDQVGFLHNLLRMATLHLGDDRLREFVERLRRQPAFPAALARVLAGDASRRRAEIAAFCWYDDRWFFERFGPGCYA